MQDNERRRMENQLMMMGLKRLDDPQLIAQLGHLVTDHWFLMGLINECDQEKRVEMYEAIKPHLKFKPKPLEDYILMLKEQANAMATLYKPVEVGEQKMEYCLPQQATGVVIEMRCYKCTRIQRFHAKTPVQAAIKAREKGWVRDLGENKEICPKCPARRTAKWGQA